MRRFVPVLLLASILLGACSPIVTLLTRVPAVTATPAATSTPLPATATALPPSTPLPNLGVRPDMLQGVEVLVWHGFGGSSADLFARMAAEFTSSNKWSIKLMVTASPNLSTLTTEVGSLLGTPDQPDIVAALPEQILTWQDNAVDLSPYLVQPEFGLDAAEIINGVWDQSFINGARYGVPLSRSARFLFYNTSFAHYLGFDTAPQTSEDFRKQACAANAFWKQDTDLTNDGYGGLALDVVSNWQTPYSWLAAAGGKVFVDGKFHFNTPENLAALEFFSGLKQAGCAWQPSSISNFEHLASRRALFITGSLGDIAGQNQALSAAASPDKWTLLPFPGEKPAIFTYGPDLAVLKSSGVRQLAAWLFIRWMLEEKNQVLWSRSTGLLPVTTSAVKTLQADAMTIPELKAALKLMPQSVPYPQSADWRRVNKILADGFMAYGQGLPLADAFTELDATIAELTK